jgi:hypothetical protein
MRPLPKPPTGDAAIVNHIRELHKCIRERTPLRNALFDIDFNECGWVPKGQIKTGISGSVSVRRLAVASVSADYLMCYSFDHSFQVDTSSQIPVAKDPTFRGNDPRQITGPNGVLVNQDLDPHYTIGGVIYAVLGIGSGTDVNDGNGNKITALEISPSRQWVDQWVKVCATVDGVQHQIAVRGTTVLPGT